MCLVMFGKASEKITINRKLKLKSPLEQDINLIVDGVDEGTGGRFIKFPDNITDLNLINEFLYKFGRSLSLHI